LAAARFRTGFATLAAFVSGVLIAVPLFDLLPEALTLGAEAKIPPHHVMYMVALGFLFLLTLSRCIAVHHICEGGECRNVRHPQAGWFGASELSVHSFMDGFAIGLGFQTNTQAGLLVAAAVIVHDFSDGMNAVTIILPFFAGGFLYLGASDLLSEAHEKNPPLISLLSTLAGFLVIFIIMQVL
jgi:ZIP family zinc transporter